MWFRAVNRLTNEELEAAKEITWSLFAHALVWAEILGDISITQCSIHLSNTNYTY
jgi:hypothetical protein